MRQSAFALRLKLDHVQRAEATGRNGQDGIVKTGIISANAQDAQEAGSRPTQNRHPNGLDKTPNIPLYRLRKMADYKGIECYHTLRIVGFGTKRKSNQSRKTD